jgi:PQQ-dependent catabolism-associated CXXCW motif protein
MRPLFLAILLFAAQAAYGEIPAFYHPMEISPPFSFSERLIDLTPAFEKARQLNKPLLVYLGANDCPPCKHYTAFLEQHEEEMKPVFAKLVVVDIRTWLKGPKLIFQIYDKRYNIVQFKALVGDTNKGLFYPTWWLLTPEGKQVRQLPQSSFYFTSVESHIRLLEGTATSNKAAPAVDAKFAALIGSWKVEVEGEKRLREFAVFRLLPTSSDTSALEAGYGWADGDLSYVDAKATLKRGNLELTIVTPASSIVKVGQVDANTFRGTFTSKRGNETPLQMSRRVLDLSNIDTPFANEDKDFGVPPTTTLSTTYHAETPISVPGASTIRTLALRRLMESAKPPILIDVLGGTPGKRMAIPSAVWLGSDAGDGREFAADKARFAAVLSKLTGGDKTKPLVFYCLGVECWLSYNASLRALEEGYKNVDWYRGGWQAWRTAGLPFERAEPYAW